MHSEVFRLQSNSIEFKDYRHFKRYHSLLECLLTKHPSQSFPNLFKEQYSLKGLYRFINNPSIDQDLFQQGYQSGLEKYSTSVSGTDPWYLIQDTMLTEYNSRQLDLGYTQTEKSNGFLLHHGLLLDDRFVPLGLLHQDIFHREKSNYGKLDDGKSRSIEEKESKKWLSAVETGHSFTKRTTRKLIQIMDREADIVEVMNACQDANQSYVIRARHDRSTLTHKERYKKSDLEQFRLFQLMESFSKSTIIHRQLKNAQGKSYDAVCELKYNSFEFRGMNSSVTCVNIKEVKAKTKEAPIQWHVLTNLPVSSFEEAEAIIDIYTKRWIIEDFHKCYKTGCSIEQRQFDSRKTLTTALSLLALIAVELLRSRFYSIHNPNESFENIVTDIDEQKLAKVLGEKHMKPIDYTIAKSGTTLWWILLLGRLGGHQGFKQKGLPGWQVIWRGYSYFQSLLEGYKIANSNV